MASQGRKSLVAFAVLLEGGIITSTACGSVYHTCGGVSLAWFHSLCFAPHFDTPSAAEWWFPTVSAGDRAVHARVCWRKCIGDAMTGVCVSSCHLAIASHPLTIPATPSLSGTGMQAGKLASEAAQVWAEGPVQLLDSITLGLALQKLREL